MKLCERLGLASIQPTYGMSNVHLFGLGGEGSRVWINPALRSVFHPFELIHAQFYANAACVAARSEVADRAYTARLTALQKGLAPGVRLMLLAMDYFYDESGNPVPSRTVFQVPNHYASEVAERHAGRFEWIASIHPYRANCVEALEWARAHGARAVKWIPSAMGINPASPACDRFYGALARLDVPLLTHGGYEHPLIGSGTMQEFNNPLALRRALGHGVRLIVAHCASTGVSIDTDRGVHGPEVENFALFEHLMDDPRYHGKLYGDISALTLREIRRYNPLLFDFVLKRKVSAEGTRFASSVFETAGFFNKAKIDSVRQESQQRRF